MVRERRRTAWDHTARICTVIANSNPQRKKNFQDSDFHPYLERKPQGIRITADNIDLVIAAFVAPERRLPRPGATSP